MNLRQVEAFQAVMETKSVTEAGKILFISQPAVSRLIADFEYSLGFSLFERRKGRLHPTEEAKLLHHEVDKAFIGLRRIEQTAQSIKTLEKGHLRIISQPGISNELLPDMIAEFSLKYPDISIFLDSRPNKEIGEWIRSGFYDIAVVTLPVDKADVSTRSIITVDLCCIMPTNHRLSKKEVIDADDFEGESFISYPTKDRYYIDKFFSSNNVTRRLKIETRATGAIINLVAAGMGISVIPPFSPHIQESPRVTNRKCSFSIPLEVAVLLPEHKTKSIITSHFVDFFDDFMNHNYGKE